MRTIGLIAVIAGLACAQAKTNKSPRGELPSLPTHIKIVESDIGKRFSQGTTRMSVSFATSDYGTNGTALIVDALRKARAKGAAWITDLTIILAVQLNGANLECRTSIRPKRSKRLASTAPAVALGVIENDPYSSTVDPFKPDVATATVGELAYGCRKHAQMQNERGDNIRRSLSTGAIANTLPTAEHGNLFASSLEQKFDASNARGSWGGIHPYGSVTTVRFIEQCGFVEALKHRVTRYRYQLAAKFTPPNIAFLTERFADDELEETDAECYEVATPSVSRLEAKMHKRSEVFSLPSVAPRLF